MAHRAAPRVTWKATVIAFAIGTAFPRLWRWALWSTRLPRRRLLLCVLVEVVALTLLRGALVPWLEGRVERHRHAVDALRRELGREPTEDEVIEWMTADRTGVQSAHAPPGPIR